MIHTHTFGATPSIDIYPLNALFLTAQSLHFLLESGLMRCRKETNQFLFKWKKRFHLCGKVSLLRN